MTPYIIRPVAEADATQITEIYNYYINETTISFETEPLKVDEMRNRIDDIAMRFPYFVATTQGDNRVVGYCYAHQWKERAAYGCTFEVTIYLDKDAKGHGLGTALMSRLIDECRKRGDCRALIACITAENTESLLFHSKMGFEKVSHFKEVGRKFNRWLDVVDMEMVLNSRHD